MSTMEQTGSVHSSHGLYGLEVSPLGDGDHKIKLPTCIESNCIPDAYCEVPGPDDVREMFEGVPSWDSLWKSFPVKDPNWKTLLLSWHGDATRTK